LIDHKRKQIRSFRPCDIESERTLAPAWVAKSLEMIRTKIAGRRSGRGAYWLRIRMLNSGAWLGISKAELLEWVEQNRKPFRMPLVRVASR
jgi:hypothetical protein